MLTVDRLLDVIPALSLAIALVYYAITINSQNKTRQAQLFMQLYQDLLTVDNMRTYLDLLNSEWTDYDDYERKYGSDFNPDNFAKRNSLWFRFNGIGSLMGDKLIDPDKVFDLLGTWTIWQWMKWEDIIKELRRRYNQPEILKDFEYLAEEMKKIRVKRGIEELLPLTYTKYIPEST